MLKLGNELTIVGEEVEAEDEEDQERGREGDTEEGEEEDENLVREEKVKKASENGHADEEAVCQEKVDQISKSSLDKESKAENLTSADLEVKAIAQDEENKMEPTKATEVDEIAEELKIDDKTGENKENNGSKEDEATKVIKEKENADNKKGEDKGEEAEKKTEVKVVAEIEKHSETPVLTEIAAANSSQRQAKEGSQNLSETETVCKSKETEVEKIEEKISDKEESKTEVPESKEEPFYANIKLDTAALGGEMDAKSPPSTTGQNKENRKKKSSGEKEMLVVRNFSVTLDEVSKIVKHI